MTAAADDDYYQESNRAYYEDGFSSYHPDTIDPSPWALVVTLTFCVTLILLLPLGVAVQQWLYKRRKQNNNQNSTQAKQKKTHSDKEAQTTAKRSKTLRAFHDKKCEQEEVSAIEIAPTKGLVPHDADNSNTANANNDYFVNSTSPFFFLDEQVEYEDDDDDESLYGLGAEDSSTEPTPYLDVWEDDADNPRVPKKRFKRARGIANLLLKRIKPSSTSRPHHHGSISKKSAANKVDEEAVTQDSINYVSMSDATVPTTTQSLSAAAPPPPPTTTSRTNHENEEDFLSFSYSDSDSGGSPDLLLQLVEEFDELNGIDDVDNRSKAKEVNDDDDDLLTIKLSDSTAESDPTQDLQGKAPTIERDNPESVTLLKEATNETPTELDMKKPKVTAEKSKTTSSKYDVDLCFGRRPWYGYFFSRGFLRKLRKCASWDDEMKNIVGLAFPYTLHAAVTSILELIEIMIVGRLIAGHNATLLGAYFAIDFVLSLSCMLLDGVINSLTVLCSHAVGAQNLKLAGKYVQLAIMLYLLIFVPIMIVCWNRIDSIVLWLGFEEYEAAEAEAYGRFAFVTTAIEAVDTALHHILDVTGLEWYSSILDMTHALASLVGVFAVGFFPDNTPLWSIGAVHLALSISFCLLNTSIVIYKKWLLGFWDGFCSVALRDARAVRTFLKTAAPLSLGYVVEYCEWEILFVFAAAQGPAEVAVWGLLGYIWEFAEEIGEAIADASEVRVAQLVGSHRPAAARYSSHKSLLLGVMASLCMASVILGLQHHLPAWLTTDETLQGMLSDLLPLVCVGLAALTFGNMSWTILCAQGRMRLATAMTFFGSVLVTLPLSVVSTFVLNMNLQGLLASIVLGYGLSGIVNSFIMVTSKWERISDKVSKRNTNNQKDKKVAKATKKAKNNESDVDYGQPSVEVELMEVKGSSLSRPPDPLNTTAETSDDDDDSNSTYDDYDWEELPKQVQVAAKALGYSKRKWDHSIPTKFHDYDWDELTPGQQDAAVILGYNKARWDDDDSDEEDHGLGEC